MINLILIALAGTFLVYFVARFVNTKYYWVLAIFSLIGMIAGIVTNFFNRGVSYTLLYLPVMMLLVISTFNILSKNKALTAFSAIAQIGSKRSWSVVAAVFYMYICYIIISKGVVINIPYDIHGK